VDGTTTIRGLAGPDGVVGHMVRARVVASDGADLVAAVAT
jgi:hypothetical protein